jgi:endonuclease/exonuclease/phosphatase family metal-dependent hydrolase
MPTKNNRFRLFLCLALALVSFSATAGEKSRPEVSVMTQNMYQGTDLSYLFYFMQTNPMLGVQLTFQQVVDSDIPGRAAILADEIAAKRPDVVALQEASLWRTGSNPTAANDVAFDQLQLLLDALKSRGRNYRVVAVNELTDVALPMSASQYVRFTDRDAVIARSDLPKAELDIYNVETHRYSYFFAPFGIPAHRGWISANVKVGELAIRFAATHLETTYAAYPEVTLIQVAQAQELMAALGSSQLPVVLVGDFNSNAAKTPYEQTPTYPLILQNGFTDVWAASHPGAPGFTWPTDATANERIDLIFTRGIGRAQWVKRVGADAPYPSDHLGVAALIPLQ